MKTLGAPQGVERKIPNKVMALAAKIAAMALAVSATSGCSSNPNCTPLERLGSWECEEPSNGGSGAQKQADATAHDAMRAIEEGK